MSQIEEQNIDDIDSINAFNKDRCNPEPTLLQPTPVNLQEVDIFPGPHSYIHRSPNVSPKVLSAKKDAKATCGEEIQNGGAILTPNQPHGTVDDKHNDKESTGL